MHSFAYSCHNLIGEFGNMTLYTYSRSDKADPVALAKTSGTYDQDFHKAVAFFADRSSSFAPTDFEQHFSAKPGKIPYGDWAALNAQRSVWLIRHGAHASDVFDAVREDRRRYEIFQRDGESDHAYGLLRIEEELSNSSKPGVGVTIGTLSNGNSAFDECLTLVSGRKPGIYPIVFTSVSGTETELGNMNVENNRATVSLYRFHSSLWRDSLDMLEATADPRMPFLEALPLLATSFFLSTNLHPLTLGGDATHRSVFSAYSTNVMERAGYPSVTVGRYCDFGAFLASNQNNFVRDFCNYLKSGGRRSYLSFFSARMPNGGTDSITGS